ncbi:NahK/ErcS family hybrid sensor histidine kinase/response regulator [Dokdonella sp.]|uniref:hybrid sensor histidine kinase/response regulator n=1 Tax=Dokdonella sp. TaxID=2291710 RepID=UPI001B06E020|nr:NahK/ErcS family hybrid sensor histidine kinase/response regulator [Dokdonella sp.]MBO9661626.1 PAS-domain containing protein [Dokdonella sp.]
MIAAWLLMLVSVLYVAALFAIAYYGDRRPLYPARAWLRPIVYSLALAVYCSSWTFYGAVGTAARGGLSYLPIYVGPILLFLFGFGLLERLVLVAKERNVTSIADFIASRFGKSHALAALVTVIAVIAAIPYLALQLKAVALSFDVLSGAPNSAGLPPLLGDSAFYVALLLAMFAILFGTRGIDATEHHHGMMLAIAAESVVKLLAFVAVGVYALYVGRNLEAVAAPLTRIADSGLPPGFLAQSALAFAAIFCLPRQFQVAVVECEHAGDLRRARWMFPLYLAVISALVLPIATAGMHAAQGSAVAADAYVLWLPLAHDNRWLAVFAYIGGFSAATGMVIVASVALSTMVSNDLVMPALLRVRALKLEQRTDLSAIVLGVRRIAIVALGLFAFLYYRFSTQAQNLAAIGLLSFAAVAQFAPAIVCGLYWRGASRLGVIAGLLAGFTVWAYTLLLPSLAVAGWLPTAWIEQGPYGIDWLKPHALFLMSGWEPVTHGAFWSLLANVGGCVFVSLRFRPGVEERLRAAAFLDPYATRATGIGGWRGRVRVADLAAIAERIVGEKLAARAFAEYAESSGKPLTPESSAERALVQHIERVLAGAIGAASARRMLTSALRGTGLDLSEAATLLDETSQELRFNRELLAVTFDNMLQGISVVDRDLRIVAWNRRYLDLFAYPDGFVYVGRPVADLIRQNAAQGLLGRGDLETQIERRLDHLRAGTPHVFVRERPDGRVIETRGEPLPGGGYLTTFSDITPYKHVENALRDANETLEQRVAQRTGELELALVAEQRAVRQAEAANQSRTRFLAAASHDLLQPLNAARLFTSALRHQPLDEESGRLAERIDTAFKAAEDLLDALLEASRLEAGKYQVEVSDFALGELMESLQQQFGVLAATRGLRLRFAASHAWVRSDAQLLRRILQNFLANALRYTKSGGVVCGVRRAGANLRIEVWDSGPGIADDQLVHVFDEFRRGSHASPWGEKGLGLGLAICERMARLLDARIDVRSQPGRGSVFSVEVPRASARSSTPRTRITTDDTTALAGGLHALCLDNDPAILDGMSALLTRWGVSCDLAGTPGEALAALQRRRPDLLLVDFHLDAAQDGLEALGALRTACDPPPPGALITADTSAELAVRARALGYALLRKPVKPAALRALIMQLGRNTERRPA